jgi:hypothetical protein
MGNIGTQKEHPDEINLTIQPTLWLTGMKLSKLTQSLAYQGIQQKKTQSNLHQRRATTQMINQIQNEVKDTTGKIPSEDQIWKAVRHKYFSRNAHYFLWMATHDAY